MAKRPETRQMELAIEQMASSRRRSFWTKDDVVRVFLKRNASKRQELAELAELDRRTQAKHEGEPEAFARVHQERELQRLRNLAGYVMRTWREEDYGLHRRFGAWQATRDDMRSEWRWFEVRYCAVSFLQLWRDLKDELRESIALTIEETDVILGLARKRQAQTVNKVYGEAMARIAELRQGRAA